jgi:hypothetical protein
MHGLETYKAAISGEAEIGVGTSQPRQSVKRHTVYSDEDGRREMRLRVEFNPMGVMVVGHVELNYPLPFD